MTFRGRRRRLILWWFRDPRCYWCGRDTSLILQTRRGQTRMPDEATYDHLHSRCDPRRGSQQDTGRRNVLACRGCNDRRGREDHEMAVMIKQAKLYSARKFWRNWLTRREANQRV